MFVDIYIYIYIYIYNKNNVIIMLYIINISGNSGVYTQYNVQRKKISVKKFKELAQSKRLYQHK